MLHKGWMVLLCLACTLPALAGPRVVALSADVAELVVALQADQLLVGRDKLARQPQLARVAVIGSSRALTVPPVLAVKPDLVIGSDQAQPPGIYQQLTALGLKVLKLNHSDDPQAFADGMRRLGLALGRPAQAEALASQWQQALKPQPGSGKRMLLSYDGRLVAGRGTAGDALIRAAGGVNAAADIQGFLPMNPEAWLKSAPDIIIVAAHNAPVYGGLPALKTRPELASSSAVRSGKVLAWPAADFLRLGVGSPAVVARLRQLAS
jgi:iron complex transport system substrate-binding protein